MNRRQRWEITVAVLATAATIALAVWGLRPPPCYQPPAGVCCESCAPVDNGCGELVCAPDSGVGCGPCSTWSEE